MNLKVLDVDMSVCKICFPEEIPFGDPYVFVGKTDEELSLVCSTPSVPKTCTVREDCWRAFRVVGSMEFSLVGILSKITAVLAESQISVFAVSTFNTDYILVKAEQLDRAVQALESSGYRFI
jgi:Uncharacterized conserved protein